MGEFEPIQPDAEDELVIMVIEKESKPSVTGRSGGMSWAKGKLGKMKSDLGK